MIESRSDWDFILSLIDKKNALGYGSQFARYVTKMPNQGRKTPNKLWKNIVKIREALLETQPLRVAIVQGCNDLPKAFIKWEAKCLSEKEERWNLEHVR